MAISKHGTSTEDGIAEDTPRRERGRFKQGQGFGQAVQTTDREMRGGEHDLSKVRLPQQLIDLAISHVKTGWKTEYKPEFAPLVMTWLSDVSHCWTLRLIAALLGCSERTLFRWIAGHDEFAQAIAAGKAIQEAHFGSILLQGFKYSKSVEYVLANLHDWTAKREDTHKIIDLNREIAEREEFAQSHRVRKKVDWKKGTIEAAVVDVKPEPAAQLPPATEKARPPTNEEIQEYLASAPPMPEEEKTQLNPDAPMI